MGAGSGGWNIDPFIARLRAERPQGYLTPEDYEFAGRQEGRVTAGAAAAARNARVIASRRAQQLGGYYAPGYERNLARIAEVEAGGRERGAGVGRDILYGTRMNREGFERQKMFSAYGMEFKKRMDDQKRKDRRNAMFWNSMMGLVKTGGMIGAGIFTGNPALVAGGISSAGGGQTQGNTEDWTDWNQQTYEGN